MTHDRWLVVAMAAVCACAGFVEPHIPLAGHPQNAVAVVQMFVMAVLLFAWCKAHARAHSIQVPAGAPALVALLAVVGVPYYAFRGYPLGRALLLLVSAIATFVGLMLLQGICFVVSARLGP